MIEVEDFFHLIVFFLFLIGFSALGMYIIWILAIDQILKWVLSFLFPGFVIVALLLVFDKAEWNWWS